MSVTAPRGFLAAGATAGLKASGNPDVALVVNSGPLDSAAAVFTTNRFAAAPVLWSRQVVADGSARAVVINSGGANACTGPGGFSDAHEMAEITARELRDTTMHVGAGEVLVCSTGLIGEALPMDRIRAGIPEAVRALSADGGPKAATAILTTDTKSKTVVLEGEGFTVGGMAKGAGMLAPELATMLVTLTTDALVTPSLLQTCLRDVTCKTFDRLDSDGCMSTNDTVVLMANGASGISPSPEQFSELLEGVSRDLVMQLMQDSEGSSKDILITVRNAASEEDALIAARAISRSNLVKCAIHGEDPNWGRILSALGTTSAAFSSEAVNVSINGVMVCRSGSIGDDRSAVDMSGRAVQIDVFLESGESSATVQTNDLTAAYVHENSAYST